jgi:hypothetical protein
VPIGRFRAPLDPGLFRRILEQLRAILEGPELVGGRAEPSEPRIVLTAIAGGHAFTHVTGTLPDQTAPLQPLLDSLARATMAVFPKPQRAAQARLLSIVRLPRGGLAIDVELVNLGAEGFWIANPAAAPNRPPGNRVALAYLEVPETDPDTVPVPQVPERAWLHATRGAPPPPAWLWLAPGATLPVPLETDLNLPAGNWLGRVELYLDVGADQVAGLPRLRGCLFTKDAPVTGEPLPGDGR